MGQGRLLEPFFHDTLAAQPVADRQVCQTPLAALDGLDNSLAPTAFVFHVSRCGSTLVTQMQAALPQCIVMLAPPVLDAFSRLHHHQPVRSGGAHTLRQLVAALGQRRTGYEQHCFIKLDCWHMPWIDLRPLLARSKRHSKHENNGFEGDPKADAFTPANDWTALAGQALRSYAALEKIRRGHAPA